MPDNNKEVILNTLKNAFKERDIELLKTVLIAFGDNIKQFISEKELAEIANHQTEKENSWLHSELLKDEPDLNTIKTLIECGADIYLKNSAPINENALRQTPYDIAAQNFASRKGESDYQVFFEMIKPHLNNRVVNVIEEGRGLIVEGVKEYIESGMTEKDLEKFYEKHQQNVFEDLTGCFEDLLLEVEGGDNKLSKEQRAQVENYIKEIKKYFIKGDTISDTLKEKYKKVFVSLNQTAKIIKDVIYPENQSVTENSSTHQAQIEALKQIFISNLTESDKEEYEANKQKTELTKDILMHTILICDRKMTEMPEKIRGEMKEKFLTNKSTTEKTTVGKSSNLPRLFRKGRFSTIGL